MLDQLLGDADQDDLGSRLIAHATHQLMEGIVQLVREGKQARFRIPVALQWTVDSDG